MWHPKPPGVGSENPLMTHSACSHWSPSLLLLGLFCGPASASDWPQFLGPERNGTSDEKGLLTAWPREGPRRVWAKEVGPGLSGPVVAGQRLILFHRQGNEEVVACLDASTGQERWRV